MRTACGLVGVVSPDVPVDVSEMITSMRAVQHRGCHSWGVASREDSSIHSQTHNGRLPDARTPLRPRPMRHAIGHVGHAKHQDSHSLSPRPDPREMIEQPVVVKSERGDFAVAFTGRLGPAGFCASNTDEPDIYRVAAGVAMHPSKDWLAALHDTASSCAAAFVVLVLTESGLYYVRDTRGYRPLMMTEITAEGCKRGGGWKCVVVASEQVAGEALFRAIESRSGDRKLTMRHRTIKPGAIGHVRLDGSWTEWELKQTRRDAAGIGGRSPGRDVPRQRCSLEAINFMRGGGAFDELNIDYFREECGRELAREDKRAGRLFDAGSAVVVGCPRGGVAAGRGYAAYACLPYAQVLRAASGVARSTSRNKAQRVVRRRKEQPTLVVDGDLSGKTVVLVDDLIVRATTVSTAVALLRSAGAAYVHVRIAAPAIQSNCIWGTMLPDVEDLFAAKATPTAVRIDADSLEYLEVACFEKLIGNGFCHGCFFSPTLARSASPEVPRFHAGAKGAHSEA